MRKNSMIRIRIETQNLNKLKEQALANGLTLVEFCRQKLMESCQLDRIEFLLEQVLRKNEIRNSN